MAKHKKESTNRAAKAVGVGLMAGGLLLGAPAGIAFAAPIGGPNDPGGPIGGPSNPVGGFVSHAVNGVNGAVQNLVNQQNKGLQGIVGINNRGLQSAVSNGQATFNNANNFVRFAVQGILSPCGNGGVPCPGGGTGGSGGTGGPGSD